MKLQQRDIIDALDANDEEIHLDKRNPDKDVNTLSNRIQRIRNSVDVKHADNKTYGNKDKTRFR